jgi:hypothetical protein
MKLSQADLPYVALSLEIALQGCEPEEEEALSSLLSRVSRALPFAPFSSSSQWRASLLSLSSSPSSLS